MSSAVSPGLSTAKPDIVLLFDLDGTILSVNSYQYWVMYLLRGRFPSLTLWSRLGVFLKTAQIMLERKALHRPHSETKRQLQRLWMDAVATDKASVALNALLAQLVGTIRPNMKALLAQIAAGQHDAILTTAAAGEYARALGQRMGFKHSTTTPRADEGNLPENVREQKRGDTLRYLETLSWQNKKRIFFTDHEEDLPLMQASHLVAWYGAPEHITALQMHMPDIRIVPCLTLNEAEIVALVSSL